VSGSDVKEINHIEFGRENNGGQRNFSNKTTREAKIPKKTASIEVLNARDELSTCQEDIIVLSLQEAIKSRLCYDQLCYA
jgi:hypothetical protein